MSTVLERQLAKTAALEAAVSLRNLAARLAGIIDGVPAAGNVAGRVHSARTLNGYIRTIDAKADACQATLAVLLTTLAEEQTRAKATT